MDQPHEYGYDRPGATHFVDAMKTRRIALGISQSELARLLTAHPSNDEGIVFYQATIQRIETGERPVKLFEAIWIASTLRSELDEMLEGENLSFAYKDLVDEVRVDTMEWLLQRAEATVDSLRRTAETIDSQIASYRYSVAETPGATEDQDLVAAANRVRELHRSLVPTAMTHAAEVRLANEECAGIPRPYPRSFMEDET